MAGQAVWSCTQSLHVCIAIRRREGALLHSCARLRLAWRPCRLRHILEAFQIEGGNCRALLTPIAVDAHQAVGHLRDGAA